MIEGFTEIGINFTDADCRVTTGMRFKEVIDFWFKKHNYSKLSNPDFENLVLDKLCQLIVTEGKAMAGVMETLTFLKGKHYKIGIATSSNIRLMETVVDTLNIRNYFDALCSAQHLEFGKPHPMVYLACAKELNVPTENCLVIEDSVNGIISGKAAQMKVLAIPEEENKHNPKFSIADYMLDSLFIFLKQLPS
jgi:mannitol-1-/sugar-/sorbitol-6-/2-deoxyglucose-6-phosphatase